MAQDITLTLDDPREVELLALTTDYNRLFPNEQLSPSQFMRQHIRSWLDTSAAQRTDADKLGLRARYKLASVEDQRTIDAILAKQIK